MQPSQKSALRWKIKWDRQRDKLIGGIWSTTSSRATSRRPRMWFSFMKVSSISSLSRTWSWRTGSRPKSSKIKRTHIIKFYSTVKYLISLTALPPRLSIGTTCSGDSLESSSPHKRSKSVKKTWLVASNKCSVRCSSDHRCHSLRWQRCNRHELT